MALVLKINTVDKSSSIDWTSLNKREGLTKEPDALSFIVKKTASKATPELGDDIELLEDAVKIFAGTITERRDFIVGGLIVGYDCTCKDLNQTFDRKLVVKSYENMTAQDIIEDIVDTFTTGFTYVNIETGTPVLGSVKFNYEQPSKCIQKIADLIGYDWYIDYDGDIHFFNETTYTAPFQIDDTSGNLFWDTLNFRRNIIELKNTMIVRGGEYKSQILEADSVDKYVADGTQRVFLNIYRYSNIQVKVAGVAKTVGIDNIDDPALYDCLYNFSEKAIKFRDANKPTVSQAVVIFGDAYIPLIVQVRDQVSIAEYGEYQGIIIDKSITSVSEAKAIAKGELRKWSAGSYEGSFKTIETGLKTGQMITINSPLRGMNKVFKINRITGKARGNDHMEYTVYFVSSGTLNFTDIMVGLLSSDKKNIEIAADEVLQRLEYFTEEMNLSDVLSQPTHTSGPYKWGPDANALVWSFGVWQ